MISENDSKTDLTERLLRLGLPRVGQINFSNCLPINLPIEHGKVTIDADFVDGTPQELNCMFEDGNLEVSSTSSLVYLKGNENLTLLPELSISSSGAVGSVLFFSKRQIGSLDDRSNIHVPAASATSVRLLSLMLKMEYGIEARFRVGTKPDIDDPSCDAALVIGDRALQIDDDWSGRSDRLDMATWWTKRFELPMVFGVFVARKDFVEQFPDKYRHISERLVLAKQIGTTAMLDDVIKTAKQMTGMPDSRLEHYFRRELNYDLESAHLESLHLLRQMLVRFNLL